MSLQTNITLTPTTGGTAVALHGCKGQILLSVRQGARFRRPSSSAAGYQHIGSDAPSSVLEIWHATATIAAAKAVVALLNSLVYSLVSVTYKEHTGLRCVVTGIEITKLVATRGSIITGSTPALARIEGTITLEHAP